MLSVTIYSPTRFGMVGEWCSLVERQHVTDQLVGAEELRIPKMSLDTKVFVELIANQSFPSTV